MKLRRATWTLVGVLGCVLAALTSAGHLPRAVAHPAILWGLPDVSVRLSDFDTVTCDGDVCGHALHPAGLPPDGDHIDLTVTDHALGVAANSIEICLRSSAQVTWWKELKVQDAPDFAEYNGAIYSDLSTQDTNHGPACQQVTTAALSHAFLVFSKAKFLGIHTDMFFVRDHLDDVGGARLTFLWNTD